MKKGVLVVNVGSPDAPEPGPVREYLREFLGDPRVLDMNPVGRWLLLNLIILPRRPKQSAEAYKQIWTDQGSPLLVHGRALVEGLRAALPDCEVELAMRYGKPSIADVIAGLRAKGCDRLVVFPVYPQYASSTTGTVLEAVYREAAALWNTPSIAAVPPFYDDDGFLGASAEVGRPTLDELAPDHVLFSFHGLPERHVQKSDETGQHCLKRDDCCASIVDANRNCYRAQCYVTARGIAARLELAEGTWSVAFQSRLGKTPWIRPYTDEVIDELAKQGVKRLAVFCPAFTADCLETLEEIGMRGAEQFTEAGGEVLRQVPCVNAHPSWIRAAADLVRGA